MVGRPKASARPQTPARAAAAKQQLQQRPPQQLDDLAALMAHDVGLVILQHLASTQERVRVCRSVSKEVRALVDGQVLSLRANLGALASGGARSSSSGARLPLRLPRLRQLSFERPDVSDAAALLSRLAAERPGLLAGLESLDLSSCQGLTPGALAALLAGCTQLRALTLPPFAPGGPSRQEFADVLSEHGGQLTCLAGAGDYAGAEQLPLLASLTALQCLDLAPQKAAPLLLPLPGVLAPLERLRALTSLTLGNQLATYEAAVLAARLPRLSRLAFSYVGDYRPLAPDDLAPLGAARKLQQLELVCVRACDGLLAAAARAGVERLCLAGGGWAAGPKAAALLGGQLRQLDVRLAGLDVPALAEALPHLSGLTRLALALHRSGGGAPGLLPAVFSLGGLHELSLACNYSGFAAGELAGLADLQALTSLRLTNHFDDAALAALLPRVPRLRQLSLASCAGVSDAGLAAAAAACPQLRGVRLSLLRGVSGDGLAALAAGAPRVMHLVVEGCRNVADEECRSLPRRLGRLELEVVWMR